jgi:hypothetical protein
MKSKNEEANQSVESDASWDPALKFKATLGNLGLPEFEEEYAEDGMEKILSCLENLDGSQSIRLMYMADEARHYIAFILGAALKRVRDTSGYRTLRAHTFEDLVSEQLEISVMDASEYILLYDTLSELSPSQDDMGNVGWARLRLHTREIDKNNFRERNHTY